MLGQRKGGAELATRALGLILGGIEAEAHGWRQAEEMRGPRRSAREALTRKRRATGGWCFFEEGLAS